MLLVASILNQLHVPVIHKEIAMRREQLIQFHMEIINLLLALDGIARLMQLPTVGLLLFGERSAMDFALHLVELRRKVDLNM